MLLTPNGLMLERGPGMWQTCVPIPTLPYLEQGLERGFPTSQVFAPTTGL